MSGGSVPALVDAPPPATRRKAGQWGDFAPRLISALVLLPLALLCCWLGGAAWAAILAAGAVTVLLEWVGMCRQGRLPALFVAIGVAAIALAFLSLLWLRASPTDGLADVLFLLTAVWTTDIGAYLCGRWIGGAKMAPAISPGKTWSGAIGGALAAVGACLALSWRWPHGAAGATVVLALLVSVAAQAGDLLESAAKRRCGVKDAGRLIPGHGGLLDRVDGILGAAPVLAALGLLLGRGIVLWN